MCVCVCVYVLICMWHNVYCHKKINLMSQIQILDEAICISLCANAPGKGMNLSVFPQAMDKIVAN